MDSILNAKLVTIEDYLFFDCSLWVSLKKGVININDKSIIDLYSHLKSRDISFIDTLGNSLVIVDGEKCFYCGKQSWSVDHIFPQYSGGDEHPENLVPCCKACNSSKGKKELISWLKEVGFEPTMELIQRYLKQLYLFSIDCHYLSKPLEGVSDVFLANALKELSSLLVSRFQKEGQFDTKNQLTLYEAVMKYGGRSNVCVIKHLRITGLIDWKDCNRENLMSFHDHLVETLSPNSAKVYSAILCSVISRHQDGSVCPDYRAILYVGRDLSSLISLSREELRQFILVPTQSTNKVAGVNEEYVKSCFILESLSGIKANDIKNIHQLRLEDGVLSYKKGSRAYSNKILGNEAITAFNQIKDKSVTLPLMSINRIIRRLAQRAGITTLIKIRRKGQFVTVEKWECISSRTAHITFCELSGDKQEVSEHPNRSYKFSIIDEVFSRLILPFEKIERINLGTEISRRVAETGFSFDVFADALHIDRTDFKGIIEGTKPTDIHTIERLLWLLKMEVQ